MEQQLDVGLTRSLFYGRPLMTRSEMSEWIEAHNQNDQEVIKKLQNRMQYLKDQIKLHKQ